MSEETWSSRIATAASCLRTPHPPAKRCRHTAHPASARNEAADLDIATKTDIPNDGFAKRVAGVSNDRLSAPATTNHRSEPNKFLLAHRTPRDVHRKCRSTERQLGCPRL